MVRRLFLLLVATTAFAAQPISTAMRAQSTDAPASATGVVPGYAIVILSDPPLAAWPGAARSANGKLDFSNGANGRYQASLAQARNSFKQWLRSSGSPAQVVREYDTVLNGLAVALNGATVDSLRAAPGVTTVEPSLSYRPTMDRSPALINAPAAWSAVGGVANAGAGIKVGVIDTGIDQNHPFINDGSLTAPFGYPKFDPGNQQFTNGKVIVARVYYTGKPGLFTAEAIQEHGTHVSGTIAGVHGTTAPAAGAMPEVDGLSGIAPKAYLGNYNVFPGQITNAASHDIAEAIEDAVKDGMDVINMSLGGGINGYQDQLTAAVNRAAQAGVVVAVAAGNSGPGVNTVESPGQAALAITAGASTNDHYFGVAVHVGAATYGAEAGTFDAFAATPAVNVPLANWNGTAASAANGSATQACSTATTNLTGYIVVIDRGTCSFSTKIRNAQAAGAFGVLMVNNVAGDPIAMGEDGTPNQPTIPAVMLAQSDRTAIRTAAAAAATASIDGTHLTEIITANGNYLASFSSRGPTNLLDIKPDVVAPGVNIYSSIPGGTYAVFQGTSMATPHVAGSAALLRQQHPTWTVAMVKSALVDSATRWTALGTTNPQNIGGGGVNLAGATTTTAVLEPAVLSFRKIEPESSRSKTITVTLTNVSTSTQTFTATAAVLHGTNYGTGIAAGVSPGSVQLAAGQSTTLTVTVDTSSATESGQYWGDLTVIGGGSTVKAPLWFGVRTYVDAGPLY